MTESLDRLLAYQLAAHHYPGAIVHVEQEGAVLDRRCVGRLRPDSEAPMREDALFRIASLTKPVVSVAALMLVDEGRLSLDAPVAQYLPALAELRTGSGKPPSRAPTLRDLLRHTSGFAYPTEIRAPSVRALVEGAGIEGRLTRLGAEAFVRRLASAPLAVEPGTAFRYGFSTDVLGVVLEAVEGKPLGQVLRARIFDRLGMGQTSFVVRDEQLERLAQAYPADAAWHARIAPLGMHEPGQPWLDSGGGLVSTIDDYAKFARMLADGARAGGEPLLSGESFALLSRDQLPVGVDGPSGYTGPGFGFSLGLAVRLDWGPAAMPSRTGELAWSGLSGTALFVDPARRWFALAFTCNTSSRMMARLEFRRALEA